MPELPEMENYKNLLSQKILNKPIIDVKVNREKSINVPVTDFEKTVLGSSIVSIERRAKHLLFQLDDGHILLLHLMLGGWMFYGKEDEKPERTIQVQISFGEKSLYFIGLRLGYLHLLGGKEMNERLQDFGPEPLRTSFTEKKFLQLIKKKRGIIKTVLTDQRFISGIGNCYTDEICFNAGILPMRKTFDLEDNEIQNLYQAIKKVLSEAIFYGGYMEEPLFIGDKLTGQYNDLCKVYDRGGEPCVKCNQRIIQAKISSKKVFYCMNCQA